MWEVEDRNACGIMLGNHPSALLLQILPQNFNARQDGRVQLYKLNNRLMDLDRRLREQGNARDFKTVWMCREFDGYYVSVFRWSRTFFSRVAPMAFSHLAYVPWWLFKALTLERTARHHAQELRYAWDKANNSGAFSRATQTVCFLTYESLISAKAETLAGAARKLGMGDLAEDASLLASLCEASTKPSMMLTADAFDPLADYAAPAPAAASATCKVNLRPHAHALSAADRAVYDECFAKAFAGVDEITCYADLVAGFQKLLLAEE